MAGQQAEVDQGEDVVDRVVVLGDAESPADLRTVGRGVRVRQLLDDAGRDAGGSLSSFERPFLDAGGVLVEAGRGVLDELSVVHAGRDDLPGHGVGQSNVGTDLDPQP